MGSNELAEKIERLRARVKWLQAQAGGAQAGASPGPGVMRELKTALDELLALQREMEQALQESEARFLTLAESSPVAVLILQDGRICYANATLSAATGYTPEELYEKEFLELLSPESRAEFDPPWSRQAAPSTAQPQRWELQLQTRSGEKCWMDLTAGSMQLQGRTAWILSAYDITGRVQAESMRTGLLRRLVTAQEDERSRIARELHDQVGQSLGAIILGLKSLEEQAPEEAAGRLKRLRKLAEGLSQDTHRLARDLRPAALDDLGLRAALENYAEEWAEHYQVQVDCQMDLPPEGQIPTVVATSIYRIAQEALTNVARHAQAQKVSLILNQRKGDLVLIVEDDGQGFLEADSHSFTAARGRLGLLGMKERAELAGGKLILESVPGKGTAVFVRVPIGG